jgi:signal transduction histidine kinase
MNFRADVLQWATGLLCSYLGAMMLVLPNEFHRPYFAFLEDRLSLWGITFLFGGILLLTSTIVRPRPIIYAAVHFLCGGLLFVFMSGFIAVRAWAAVFPYVSFVVLICAAPFLNPHTDTRRDLFSLAMVVALILNSLVYLGGNVSPTSDLHNQIVAYLPLVGAWSLLGGAALGITIFWHHGRYYRHFYIISHVVAGILYWMFCIAAVMPNRLWVAVGYYGGCGTILLMLPWLQKWMYTRFDRVSLRVRIAFALAIMAALLLIFQATIIADRQEREIIDQTLELEMQQVRALSLQVSGYLSGSQAPAIALAQELAGVVPSGYKAVLDQFHTAYLETIDFVAYGVNSEEIYRVGTIGRSTAEPVAVQRVNDTGKLVIQAGTSLDGTQLRFAVAAPIMLADNTFAGVVIAAIDGEVIRTILTRTRGDVGIVYLVDEQWRVVIHTDAIPIGSEFADAIPVQQMIAGNREGTLEFEQRNGQQDRTWFAGYAIVPGLNWGVVSQRPDTALSAIRTGRELAFGMVILLMALAFAVGTVTANLLIAPLRLLTHALTDLAKGDSTAPLPAQTRIAEVDALAEAYNLLIVRLDERTKQRDQAEQGLRGAILARDEFLSIAAHELKTPITSLRGFAQLLLRQISKNGTLDMSRTERALQTIDIQSDKLARLVSHLLDISKLQAGKFTLACQHMDVVPLVREVINNLQSIAAEHTIQLDTVPSLSTQIDPLRFEQVVTNVVENAIKYSPNGGNIEVVLRVGNKHGLELSVRDHGIGIPPERRDHIFDRYFQAHTDGHFSGMGLGLYICKQIIELHDGTLTVAFPDDGGTQFTITVP